jgi:SepF-like predicted cell division protein (DUF552 family)
MEEQEQVKTDRRSEFVSPLDHMLLIGRVTRLEERYTDLAKVMEKLANKVDDVGNKILKASLIIVGGVGVIILLTSGVLTNLGGM